ncbi:hypothetical protein P8C59_008096 [Phyllachora maydis]|uniref:chitinase n=1 Tax=Phyllachora maydis TaxID=1825666 RepID=A0AAD9I9S4_9PEZI|nr:hypothetical protein P8C59_008096 [Phyllachora maydis]
MSSSTRSRKARMASASNVMYTNAVYWPNQSIYAGHSPGSLNYGCINHVYYAYASVAPDGGVFLSDEYADVMAPVDGVQGGLGSLMHLKQLHAHLQVVLSIGGAAAADVFPTVASNAMLRHNFARSARDLVEASGLDGIDVAWEYPCTPEQGVDFLALLAAIRLQLPEEHYLLTAALPAAKGVLQCIDLAQAAAHVDFVNLAAYDFCGPWTHRSGHQAQLYSLAPPRENETSGAAAVQSLLAAGVPGKKVLLGIPLFGRSFLHAGGPGQRFRGAGGLDGCFLYNELPRPGTREQTDKKVVAAQCVGADGGFVSYDNPETVKTKAGFCQQKGLGGLFYCNASADAADSQRSLVATGFRALHSS